MATHIIDAVGPTLSDVAETLGARPLFVMPHPDDESYAFGGLLRCLGVMGAAPQLLCCTAIAGSPRHRELNAAWRALGLDERAIHVGAMPDGRLEDAAVEPDLRAAIARLLPNATALAVLGPEGVYGHRDHVAVWRAAAHLWQQTRPCPLVWPIFADGEVLFGPLRGFLRRTAPGLLTDAPTPLAPPHRCVHVALDPDAREAKRAAMAAHESQLPRGKLALFLGRGVTDILSANESYAIAECHR